MFKTFVSLLSEHSSDIKNKDNKQSPDALTVNSVTPSSNKSKPTLSIS